MSSIELALDAEPEAEAEPLSDCSSRSMKVHCKICEWRNDVLPCEDAEPVEEVHTPVGETKRFMVAMFEAMHAKPADDIWMDILNTRTLSGGRSPDTGHRDWFFFPLRNMQTLSPQPSADLLWRAQTTSITCNDGREIKPESDGFFKGWHMIQTCCLVSPHPRCPGSNGVLQDGRMRHGIQHGDGIGVYFHASPPWSLYTVGDGWCMLELRVRPFLCRVKGGSRGRYLLKSNQSVESCGTECPDIQVVGLWHMYRTLPEFVKV